MKFTEKRKRRVRNVIISMMIICAMPLLESGRPLSGAITEDCFSGKEIVCAIDLCDDMYGAHGLETGFNYQLLNRFAEDNRCNIRILRYPRTRNN